MKEVLLKETDGILTDLWDSYIELEKMPPYTHRAVSYVVFVFDIRMKTSLIKHTHTMHTVQGKN